MSVSPRPAIRLIDPRGQRFGAALSVLGLIAALVFDLPLVVGAIGLALGISALFGTRYFVLGRPWPVVRGAARLGPPAEPEPEVGPRFAQALGATFLLIGFVLLALGLRPLGWVPVLAVAGLQTVLALTGYCVGCRLYGLHWWLPAQFDRYVLRRETSAPQA